MYEFFTITHNNIVNNDMISDLNKFISTNKILKVDKQYDSNINSWVFCVEYIQHTQQTLKQSQVKKEKINYKAILPAEEYSKMVLWKKARDVVSKEFGVPCYEIFKNDEIVELIKKESITIADFLLLSTYNQEKVNKYAEKLINLFNSYLNNVSDDNKEKN